MNGQGPSGELICADDLHDLLADNHELGCHTFGHCHAWQTPPRKFEESVIANLGALRRLIPEAAAFSSLLYPLSCPRPHAKRRMRE